MESSRFSAPIQDVSCVTAWIVPRVAPVSIKHKALAPKAITLLTSLTYHSTLAKKRKTCIVAAVITVGLGSEHSTLPDKGQGLCPDRAWCLSQGPAVAHSPPHGWHFLALSVSTMWQEKLFWSRSSTYLFVFGTVGNICTAYHLTSGDQSELNTHVLGIWALIVDFQG